MSLSFHKPMAAGLALAALFSGPALADVETGVEAWGRGDYAVAVREWDAPAAAGDPDAMFNLAQAYRLGRGVPADPARAEALYARAAATGHLQAADTYGLMLFDSGRHREAMPYIRDAARRGDPRAQYLLGIAHFNGDVVERDWLRAYALMTLANAAALPQAAPALAEMDAAIPLAQRQQAAGLAQQMKAEAQATRNAQVAAFDLAGPQPDMASDTASDTGPAESPRVPRSVQAVAVSPSIAGARAAIAQAGRATGTEDPRGAGASYARPSAAAAPPAPLAAASPPPPKVVAPAEPHPEPPVAAASGGVWRVQLGAFSVAANVDALWRRVEGRPELAGARRIAVPAGRVTKLQAGGFPSRSAARAACAALKRSGYDCLVTDR